MTAPVVIRFGALGDMVVLLPLLRQLSTVHGQPVRLVASGGWARPLLGGQDCVGEIRVLSSRKAPYWFNRSQRELVAWLAGQRDAHVYLCETDRKSLWLVRKAGIARDRIHWAGDHVERSDEHWIERWLRLGAQWCGTAVPTREVVGTALRERWFDVPAAALDNADQWLRERGWAQHRLVLLQPGNKRTMRRGAAARASNTKFWPDARWAELARKVLQELPDAVVLVCGSPEEAAYAQALVEGTGDARMFNVADQLPIPRLLGLLARAHSLISVDTGPAHAAAAVGCPVAVLFGTNDPARWRPYAARAPVEVIQRVDTRTGGPAMGAITVDDVLTAWRRLYAAGGASPTPGT